VPHVNPDGLVIMDVQPTISALTSSTVQINEQFSAPITNTRSALTRVAIENGKTIVIGGLMEDRKDQQIHKVPLLGDIPYVGAFFRSESRTKNRTNLMVFLRPVVMRDAESANKLSLDRYEMMRAQQKDAQPVPSIVVPINDSPVVPPLAPPPPRTAPPDVAPTPLSAPPSSPGTEPNPAVPRRPAIIN
jgi:general secretion pathway protein D